MRGINKKIDSFIKKKKCTLLGVGPMSVNIVDATIELSDEHDVPIILIASRRQIDSSEFNGGYVNNWSTDVYSKYVGKNCKKKKIILARDHGGPWQNTKEINLKLKLKEAMESAKKSFKQDIDSGFEILHIDPSIDIHNTLDTKTVLERIFELYEYSYSYAKSKGKEIIFEIGTEEQSGSTNSQEELEYTLNEIDKFCDKKNLPKVSFVVIQAGTKVMEMKNIGSFESPIRIKNELPVEVLLLKMIEVCNKYGVYMKELNTDYLTDESLQWHPHLGIHSANVAPEFGVAETKELLSILEKNNCKDLAEKFLKISYDSLKWKKWILKHSNISDRDKSIIAGHYVFSDPSVLEIKKEASDRLMSKNIQLNLLLKTAVKKSIMRYLKNFRIIN